MLLLTIWFELCQSYSRKIKAEDALECVSAVHVEYIDVGI